MILYSPVFLAVTFVIFISAEILIAAASELRLRAVLSWEHIKLRNGKSYTYNSHFYCLGFSFCWIIISALNLTAAMKNALLCRERLFYMPEEWFAQMDYEQYYAHLTQYDGRVRFYFVMLMIYITAFLMFLFSKYRYDGTYLSGRGIFCGGAFYRRKDITYRLDCYKLLFFDKKGRKFLEITTADSDELSAAENFLGRYYTSNDKAAFSCVV